MNTKTNILVIGGNGFLGNELVRLLKQKGYENVTVLSRNLPLTLLPGVRYEQGDISRPGTLEKGFFGQEIVVNCSGLVSFWKKDRQKLLEINGHGAQNVLWMSEKTPTVQRLLHVSSTAALGFSEAHIHEETQFDWEKWRKKLPYSYSKHFPNAHIRTSRLPTNIVFPSLIIGPGDPENTGKILKYVQRKKILTPPGKNSIIDVRDVAEAIVRVLLSAREKEDFILAGHTLSFAEIMHIARHSLQQENTIIHLPQIQRTLVRALGTFGEHLGAPIASETLFLSFCERKHLGKKIRELGFSPQFSPLDSFRDFVNQKTENPFLSGESYV